MLYLDYATNCPVHKEVLDTFYSTSIKYIGNPNSSHKLGKEAKSIIHKANVQISNILNIKQTEIIYTSGATESNNLAIKGVANYYKNRGKHIITTNLEHPSVLAPIQYLKEQGFEVDKIEILDNGLINLQHLKSLLREDTILVSICYVDSEIGNKQEIEHIAKILKDYPNCVFHCDASQAIGKIRVNLDNIDLISLTAHKFFGLNGIGMLLKKENIMLEQLIHGGSNVTMFRSGTPCVALIDSTVTALKIANKNLDINLSYVEKLNFRLKQELSKYQNVFINSNDNAIPFILNFSIKGIKAVLIAEELEKYDIYISTKSACSSSKIISRAVYALTKDRKLASSSIRVSLSHLTTEDDICYFLKYFKNCYDKLR